MPSLSIDLEGHGDDNPCESYRTEHVGFLAVQLKTHCDAMSSVPRALPEMTSGAFLALCLAPHLTFVCRPRRAEALRLVALLAAHTRFAVRARRSGECERRIRFLNEWTTSPDLCLAAWRMLEGLGHVPMVSCIGRDANRR